MPGETKLDTIAGPIERTGEPKKNAAGGPVVVCLWQTKPDGVDLAVVGSAPAPGIPTDAILKMMS